MPVTEGSEVEASSAVGLRGLKDLPLAGFAANPKKRLLALFERIEVLGDALDGPDDEARNELAQKIETAAQWYDEVRSVSCREFAQRVDEVAGNSPNVALRVAVGRARLFAGLQLGRASRLPEALSEYQRSVQLLEERATVFGRQYWSYSMMQCLRILRANELDAATLLLSQIVDEARSRFDAYVRNRALEATVLCVETALAQHKHERVPALVRAALSLSREEPNAYTGTAVIDLTDQLALALRTLKQNEEALEACLSLFALRPLAKDAAAVEALAWGLAEGAYIAADLLQRPSVALTFIAEQRSLLKDAKTPEVRGELAYAVSMEARCHYLLGDRTKAQELLEEVRTRAAELPKQNNARAGHAAAEVLQGHLYLAEGRTDAACEQWEAMIARFEKDTESAVLEEVSKARTLLQVQRNTASRS